MTEVVPGLGENKFEYLKMLFQVDFIALAFFELVLPADQYLPLLGINHSNKFLSLSNEEHYLILLPENSKHFFEEAKEHLTFIQNRKKVIVFLNSFPEPTEEKGIRISMEQITAQTIRNGIPRKNLYLKLLNDLLHN